jgi:spore germination protein
MKWRRLKNRSYEMNDSTATKKQSDSLNSSITQNLERIRQEIGQNSDLRFREFQLGHTEIHLAVIYIDGLSDANLINQYILNGLMLGGPRLDHAEHSLRDAGELKQFIKNRAVSICDCKEVHSITDLTTKIMLGSIGLLVDGLQEAFILGGNIGKSRSMDEPPSEALIRGPRLGFIENLSDNTALLRRLGKTKSLTINSFQVGERSKKDLAIAYLQDVVDPKLLEEVKHRIKKITIDDVQESGYVEQLIEDDFLSPFPQVQSTERPDRVLAALMEGRIAILLDGTPFVLIVPVTFSMLLQSPEDYYERWMVGSLIRMLRYFSAFVSLFTPAIYIAFISFHQGLIPTKLIFSMAATREGVPFPPLIEALIMEVSIEVLREAGLRLPKPVGQSLGIVGGLIIGEAAVQAGIVSPIMVIVVAVTAISSFSLPQYSSAIALRMLRFIAMLFSAVLGLYGVVLFFLLIASHLVRLKSFGVPYLSPLAPTRYIDWKDFIFRAPLFLMKRRPKLLQTKDSIRKR